MEDAGHILAIIALSAAAVAALASLIVGMPGTLMLVVIALVYAVATGFESVTWMTILVLLSLAAGGELIEFFSTASASAGPRPSRRVNLSAIAGSIIGSVLGLSLFFGLGALLGALGGAFVGAALASASEGQDLHSTLGQGMAAARGRLLGFVAKVAIAVGMTVVLLSAAI